MSKNLKNKNSFHLQDIKFEKEVENSTEKSLEKESKEEEKKEE